MRKIFLYKLFLMIFPISLFLVYFFESAAIAYSPVILIVIFILAFEIIQPSVMDKKDWLSIIAFFPYVLIAIAYYIFNPFEGRYLTSYLLTFLLIPFFVFVLLQLSKYSSGFNYEKFIFYFLILFLIIQFIVCIGQLSTYVFGIGFPVNPLYESAFMISGTFGNSNDLATIVLLGAFIFTCLEYKLEIYKRLLVWVLIFFILTITVSRSALFITILIFIFTRGFKISSFLYLFVFMFLGFISLSFFDNYIELGVVSRISARLSSFSNILENGLSADASMNIRINSYLHFLDNLFNLNMGSGDINNYLKYAEGASFQADFQDWLLFKNPHSLIIEIGYWLGWLGLISFLMAFLNLIISYRISISFLLVAFVSMLIPSSVMGSIVYFLFIFICFFTNAKYFFNKNSINN